MESNTEWPQLEPPAFMLSLTSWGLQFQDWASDGALFHLPYYHLTSVRAWPIWCLEVPIHLQASAGSGHRRSKHLCHRSPQVEEPQRRETLWKWFSAREEWGVEISSFQFSGNEPVVKMFLIQQGWLSAGTKAKSHAPVNQNLSEVWENNKNPSFFFFICGGWCVLYVCVEGERGSQFSSHTQLCWGMNEWMNPVICKYISLCFCSAWSTSQSFWIINAQSEHERASSVTIWNVIFLNVFIKIHRHNQEAVTLLRNLWLVFFVWETTDEPETARLMVQLHLDKLYVLLQDHKSPCLLFAQFSHFYQNFLHQLSPEGDRRRSCRAELDLPEPRVLPVVQ